MEYHYVSPSSFVETGEKIHAVFVDNDVVQWHEGVVMKLHKKSVDENGKFADCSVLFDDGDTLDTILHDVDFCSKESLDAWRFPWTTSKLIQEMEHVHTLITDSVPVEQPQRPTMLHGVFLATSFLAVFTVLGLISYCRFDPDEPTVCPYVTPWETITLASIRTLQERITALWSQ